MNQRIQISLHISAEEYLKLYQGVAQNVSAIASDGRRVQFPAKILQKYVTNAGVKGRFVIEFDRAGKFVNVLRLA